MSVLFSDVELAVYLSAGCSLDEKPGSNWVEETGGLPSYICQIARAIKRDGRSTSSAIAIAVSRVKKWATGVGVDKDTQAKAARAVASWEAKKKQAKADNAVRATRQDGTAYIMLANITSFNVDKVRRKWDALDRERRQAARAEIKAAGGDPYSYEMPYSYIKELWTDYIIVETEALAGQDGPQLFKVPYSVANEDEFTFGTPEPVKVEYVTDGDTLSDEEMALIKDLMEPATALTQVLDQASRLKG